MYTFHFSPFEDFVLFPLLWILHLKFGVKRALLKNFGNGYVWIHLYATIYRKRSSHTEIEYNNFIALHCYLLHLICHLHLAPVFSLPYQSCNGRRDTARTILLLGKSRRIGSERHKLKRALRYYIFKWGLCYIISASCFQQIEFNASRWELQCIHFFYLW